MMRTLSSISNAIVTVGTVTLMLAAAGCDRSQSAAANTETSDVAIPFTRFVLDNGLTLIVHEDHKAPIVAVNIWYHVGSKNERPGKTGFAHLFEHLMFNGSEHFNDDYFKAFDRVGATGMNGTTNADRTNYFQVVPTPALDMALWMESDRMGHLLDAVDQEKLNEQRGVVQNEKRQGENQPYGVTRQLITKHSYPTGHPYSWSTIGSMEDLEAASLDDVQEWFRTYYGAANAVVVLAGDIDPNTARHKVETYFGDIPSGPPIERATEWIAKRTGIKRGQVQDRVPQSRVYMVWNIPGWRTQDSKYLDLVSDILAVGKTSRLYKRLVYDDQISTDAQAYVDLREIGGLFYLDATVQPGGNTKAVEAAMTEELDRFLRDGVTEPELRRVKTNYRSNAVRSTERVGGFGGKSDILAKGEVYGAGADDYRRQFNWVEGATVDDLRDAARRWLSDGAYILTVLPYDEGTTTLTTVDRSTGVPIVGDSPPVSFPSLQTTTLSNGLKVILAERPAIPIVNFSLQFDAGYAADQLGTPGTASLAMEMMDEGTTHRSALQINDELQSLGARLSTNSNLDMSSVTLSVLTEHLSSALDIYADVIRHPAFPTDEFERLKSQQLARIQREKSNPTQIALRVFPRVVYGDAHAYGVPLTGSGTEAAVTGLTRQKLSDFHVTWFRPNNGTLVVVGDVSMVKLAPELERVFADWSPADVPTKNLEAVTHQSSSAVYLIDRPGSQQSLIMAGHVAPAKNNPEEIAIEAMNTVLGGSFSSRINMNLREDKHWSYGARSQLIDARGPRPFIVTAPVQTDRTKDSMQEIYAELTAIRRDHPVTSEELAKAQDLRTLTLPGRWETNEAVSRDIVSIVRYGLASDHYDTYVEQVRGLVLTDINAATLDLIQPDRLVWVVVGDRAVIEDDIRALGLGELHHVDADGVLLPQ
jgi:zinc protease